MGRANQKQATPHPMGNSQSLVCDFAGLEFPKPAPLSLATFKTSKHTSNTAQGPSSCSSFSFSSSFFLFLLLLLLPLLYSLSSFLLLPLPSSSSFFLLFFFFFSFFCYCCCFRRTERPELTHNKDSLFFALHSVSWWYFGDPNFGHNRCRLAASIWGIPFPGQLDKSDRGEKRVLVGRKLRVTLMILCGVTFYSFDFLKDPPPSSQINHTQRLILSYKCPALAWLLSCQLVLT